MKSSFIAILLLLILSGCNKPKPVYYEIWSNTDECFPTIIFYPLNDSLFVAYNHTSYADILYQLPFAYGKYSKTRDKIAFYDSISMTNYEFEKVDNELYSSDNGVFRSFQLKRFIMSDLELTEKNMSIQLIERYRTQNKLRKQLMQSLIDKDQVASEAYLDLNDKIYCDSSYFMKIIFLRDNHFKIIIDDCFVIRAGVFSLSNGRFLFHDTISNLTEEAVLLKDSTIYSTNLPFSLSFNQLIKYNYKDTIYRIDQPLP